MDKEMFPVKVYTAERKIVIEQPDPIADATPFVMISPEQVDGLIEWLKEAKAELADNTKD